MRSLLIVLLLLLPLAHADDRDLAGKYSGDWKSNSSGQGGSLTMTLTPAANNAWKCEVTFTIEGQTVATTMKQVKVENSKLDISYDFDAVGNTLRSHLTGDCTAKGCEGKYQTATPDGSTEVDSGTWRAERAKP
jgi:hypothetical protein